MVSALLAFLQVFPLHMNLPHPYLTNISTFTDLLIAEISENQGPVYVYLVLKQVISTTPELHYSAMSMALSVMESSVSDLFIYHYSCCF